LDSRCLSSKLKKDKRDLTTVMRRKLVKKITEEGTPLPAALKAAELSSFRHAVQTLRVFYWSSPFILL
jgi:hypothetical protein